jgi:hypothetical protein
LSRYEHDSKVYPECSDEHIREMGTANTCYAHVRRLHRVRLQSHQSPISQEGSPTGQPSALGRACYLDLTFPSRHLPLTFLSCVMLLQKKLSPWWTGPSHPIASSTCLPRRRLISESSPHSRRSARLRKRPDAASKQQFRHLGRPRE